ncbi:GNAT family N-acetyltransferase [Bacillus sp. NPDC077027]|uniref:GNAT family N-acetyltransferase n=1 Tax=Bacillus sp. NPDC077027 TaxID=3390548 RepID=UPI003D08182D
MRQRRNVLETDRLKLRTMDEGDKEFLFSMFQNEEVMKYYPSLKDEEQTEEWIKWNQKNDQRFDTSLWIIEDKRTGEALGQSGIILQKVEEKTELEIGYMLKRDAWGRGYAFEAAKGCISYGFEYMKVRRLISLINPANERSIQVAAKLGMKKEKTISKWNQTIDVYSINSLC